jgi:hypothetical protein
MNVEAIAAVILFLRDQSRHPHLMLPPRQDRVFGIRLCLVAEVDPLLQTNIDPPRHDPDADKGDLPASVWPKHPLRIDCIEQERAGTHITGGCDQSR